MGDGRDRAWVMQVIALYDYDPDEEDELAFREGDVLRVVRVQDDGWWIGFHVDEPRRDGLFPSNYVQIQHHCPPPRVGKQETDRSGHPRRHQHRRVLQQQRPHDSDEVDEEEQVKEVKDGVTLEDEAPPSVAANHGRGNVSSVRQLKQRLAEAEQSSRAAHDARRKAEQERLLRRYPQPTEHLEGEDELDEGHDREDEDRPQFHRQAQWRRQHRQIEMEEEEEEEEEDDDDGLSQSEQRDVDRYRGRGKDTRDDSNEEGEEVEEKEEADGQNETAVDDDDGREEDDDSLDDQVPGEFTVPADLGDRMKEVIETFQDFHDPIPSDTDSRQRERRASAVIMMSLQRNAQRSRERRHSNRQHSAAMAIQRWLVRTSSAPRARSEDPAWNQRQDAVVRIQHWTRRWLAYARWQAEVEAERLALVHSHERRQKRAAQRQSLRTTPVQVVDKKEEEMEQALKEKEIEDEGGGKKQEVEWIDKEQREHRQPQEDVTTGADCEALDGNAETPSDEALMVGSSSASEIVMPAVAPATTASMRNKKRVMKKEAVDLVKVLVQQQLSEKLREQDLKMLELHHLVAHMQGVIRQQSEVIQDTTAQMLAMEEAQHQRTLAIPRGGGGGKRGGVAVASVTAFPALNPASNGSSVVAPHSKHTSLPSASTSLPQIPRAAVVPTTRPTGIKPPRTFERTTKLPTL